MVVRTYDQWRSILLLWHSRRLSIVLLLRIWHVLLRRVHGAVGVGRRHAVGRIRIGIVGVWVVAGVHLVDRLLVVVLLRRVVLAGLPWAASLSSAHIDSVLMWTSPRHGLPSRQTMIAHLAGLGFDDSQRLSLICDSHHEIVVKEYCSGNSNAESKLQVKGGFLVVVSRLPVGCELQLSRWRATGDGVTDDKRRSLLALGRLLSLLAGKRNGKKG